MNELKHSKTARDYAQRMADDGIIDHLKVDEVESRILRYMAGMREESGNFTNTNIPVFPVEEIETLKTAMQITPRQVLDELHAMGYRITKSFEFQVNLTPKKHKLPRYMIGTKAEHKLGPLDRDHGDLFLAQEETEDSWIGHWVTGFGLINVIFPKSTSRELTPEEVIKHHGSLIQIGSNPPIRIDILNQL